MELLSFTQTQIESEYRRSTSKNKAELCMKYCFYNSLPPFSNPTYFEYM